MVGARFQPSLDTASNSQSWARAGAQMETWLDAKEAIMIAIPTRLHRIVQLLALATILTFPRVALTQCSGISEEGRWHNLDKNGEPSYIDVKMAGGCGDQ